MERVLFVCLGNICRSPAAEGVFLEKIREKGIQDSFVVDSAGTSNYHIGEPADPRMTSAARARGISLPSRARQFIPADFDEFDQILVMDESNLRDVLSLSESEQERKKVRLLRDFDPRSNGILAVPDPYFGGPQGFEEVLDILDRSLESFIESLGPQK